MTGSVGSQRFEAEVESRPQGAIAVRVPFDPSAVWGPKDRHYVRGSMDGRLLRARLDRVDDACYLQLGPRWNCDQFTAGDRVRVELEPEGPQLDNLAADFVDALHGEPDARRYFESLATFYRKNYVRWIESARKPETRQKRIAGAVADLKAARDRHSPARGA